MVLRKLVVIDAVDDGEVGILARRGNEHALGTGRQMCRGLLLRGEDAGAFHQNLDAEILVRQLRRVPLGGHLDRASADVDGIAVDLHLAGKAPVDGIVAQQMRVRLHGAEIVDRHDLDVLAPGFHDGPQDISADPAKSVDCDAHGHHFLLLRSRLSGAAGFWARRAVTASTTASAVMPKWR